jgi:pimeloyl-ACP methyl ester carboxylesterase
VRELAEAILLRAPERFHLAALSMGGYVAFEILRQAPQRVAKLVLMNTQAKADTDEHKNRRRALIELSRTGRFKGVTPRLLPNLINAKHLQNTEMTQVIFDMAGRLGQRVFEDQQTAIMHRPDSRDLLPTLTQDTMVIGGIDDQLVSVQAISDMAMAIPSAELHILDDCGHLAPLEQAEQTTALMLGFLKV